jgi:lipopolysaccharide transport system ATP-binding protein
LSSDVVIRAEGVGKKYVIGHESERGRSESLRDVIVRGARNLRRAATDTLRGRPMIVGDELEEFWALRDVNFEVRRGEVMGIIGRNGAGKSTLLKILSRITEPTEGTLSIRGRVASLLEVGTGFHPELSGRENIYLNGAILGMTRAEIRRKFDEIVDFAEIEKFLDTPVKRYSSGMYVRLAFAVAAHLEPEILIIDEVLAVGDAEFQKKCLGKMSDISHHEGRTVLFVSHNATVVEELCGACVLLEKGAVAFSSRDVREVIRAYQASLRRSPSKIASNYTTVSNEWFSLVDFRLKSRGTDAATSNSFLKSDDIVIELEVDVTQPHPDLCFGYSLYAKGGECVWWSFDHDYCEKSPICGHNNLKTVIPNSLLNDGEYEVEFLAWLEGYGWIVAPGDFKVSRSFAVKGGRVGSLEFSNGVRPGVLYPPLQWEVTPTDRAAQSGPAMAVSSGQTDQCRTDPQ